MAVINTWRALDTAWQKKQAVRAELSEKDERNIAAAMAEIQSLRLQVLRAKGAGAKRLENIRFIPRSICAMPIGSQSWYEIHSSWVRNPERMILAAFESEKYRINFTEKFDQTTQSFGFVVSLSWE